MLMKFQKHSSTLYQYLHIALPAVVAIHFGKCLLKFHDTSLCVSLLGLQCEK